MTKNKGKSDTNYESMIYLVTDDEVKTEYGQAFASVMLNPTVVWAKFILTDDRKNANGMRIPKEEFANLMKSGIHMPVKMAIGEIQRGHDGSKPLGVITHLKEMTMPEGVSAIVALAALWGEERPEDVKFIRDRFKANEPVNISWEILYGDSSFNTENDSMDLAETVLRAATVVGEPAYEGRTQFLAVAAKKWSKAYIEKLPDSAFLHIEGENRFIPIMDDTGMVDRTRLKDAMEELGKLNVPANILREKKALLQSLAGKFEAGASIDQVTQELINYRPLTEEGKIMEIDTLKVELEKVQTKLDEALVSLQAKETALSEKDTALTTRDQQIAELTEKTTQLETELASLKEFKTKADAEAAKTEKLANVKTKFTEAGIEKEEQYFSDNSEMLVALTDPQLDFMVQEMKVLAEAAKKAKKTETSGIKTRIPVLTNDDSTDEQPSMDELVQYLREQKTKK